MKPPTLPKDYKNSPEGAYYWEFLAQAEAKCKFKVAGYDGPKGSREPRICTPPLRPLTPETTLGYACIFFAENILGVQLLPFQQALLIRALETAPGHRLRFKYVFLLVARQNGKSTVAQVISLFFMFGLRKPTVVGTAQDLSIAEGLLAGCVEVVESNPILKNYIRNVNNTNGKKSLTVACEGPTGERAESTYLVKAATRKAGRGLSSDLVLLDELREQTNWVVWAAVANTIIARPNAQVWGLSNAGDISSAVLMHYRKQAHKALGDPDGIVREDEKENGLTLQVKDGTEDDDSVGLFEWSAKPGRSIMDRDGWLEANPAIGWVIDPAVIKTATAQPEAEFRTECLCQWVLDMYEGPFAHGAWDKCRDMAGVIPDENPAVFAVDVSWDRDLAYVAAAGINSDGRPQVEICAGRASRNWQEWVPEWFTSWVDPANPVDVVVNSKGCPAAALIDHLKKVPGLRVREWQGSDVTLGCGLFYDRVMAAEKENPDRTPLAHRGQEALDLAASAAVKRNAGDGWMWDRRNSSRDISPLIACTAALWWLETVYVNKKTTSIYESGVLDLI